MSRDPDEYPDPNTFKPERFLPGPGKRIPRHPEEIAFGFGRRACPGKDLAEPSIFLNIATVLAVFNISKIEVDGKVVEPHVGFTAGIISHPEPFEVDIRPRSEQAAGLVSASAEELPPEESDAEILRNVCC